MRKSRTGRFAKSERGGVIAFFLVTLVPTLLVIGLAVDLGTAYVSQSSLANAVDAGALAAVRATRGVEMSDIAVRVARSNFDREGDVRYTFGSRTEGSLGLIVELRADYESPSYFSKLFGNSGFAVSAVGAALRTPVDVSLVLDTTDSLNRHAVFNTLKGESKSFLKNFDDEIDRVGIVSFSTVAEEALPMQFAFTAAGQSAIHRLRNLIDTNLEEGLRAAKAQKDSASARDGVRDYLVLVTDGRPNALRATVPVPYDPPAVYDGVVAAELDGSGFRGLFTPDDGRRIKSWHRNGRINTADNHSTDPSPIPTSLPNGEPANASSIRALAEQLSEERAAAIRAGGTTILAVALQPPNPRYPLDTPDPDLLRRIANVDGISDTGPEGLVFSATPETLGAVMTEVAAQLLAVRLTREP